MLFNWELQEQMIEFMDKYFLPMTKMAVIGLDSGREMMGLRRVLYMILCYNRLLYYSL